MEVNICPRLISKMHEQGTKFCDNINATINTNAIPKGLYAKKTYKKGEVIHQLEGRLVLRPTRESIHIGNNLHVIDIYGQYINHSFDPNTKLELNKVVAIKDIEIRDEITFNYNESEVNMKCPFLDGDVYVGGKNVFYKFVDGSWKEYVISFI